MTSRTSALVLTVAGGALLFVLAPERAALAPGVLGGLIVLAAIWLVSGRARLVLAAVGALAWIGALALALGTSAAAALASGLGLAGAVVTLAKGSAWPGWSSRYERAADTATNDPRAMWESLDRGLDPTRPRPTDAD